MKRYCVMSGSRTGSSMLQMILWKYLKRKENYKSALGDFMIRNWIYDTGHSVSNFRLRDMSPIDELHLDIDHNFEFNRRVDLLRKYHNQKYLVKFPASLWYHCDFTQICYLKNNYHFIITDRKDKRERALSHAIAIISNWFTVRHPDQINKFKPGKFTPEIGDIILSDFLSLEHTKKVIANTPGYSHYTVWYEDMIEYEDRYEILEKMLGFYDYREYINDNDRATLSKPIGNLINKEDYITNLEEFDEWLQNNITNNIT